MKKHLKITIIISLCVAVLLVFSGSALAFPSQSGACDASGCHDDPSMMSIGANPNSLSVEMGAEFNILLTATGEAGQDAMIMKFPASVADNGEFTFGSLDAEGTVNDGDAADIDPDANEMGVNYSITAPSTPGTYTLRAYAAQHTPNSIHTDITVTVTQPAGPGPSISFINATPAIPLADEPVSVVANVSSNNAITSVKLQYSTDNRTTWNNVSMELTNGQYVGEIPGFPDGTHVIYRVVAIDDQGAESISWESEYVVGDIPPPPPEPIPQMHYGWLLGGPALVIAYIGTALEYYDEERFTRIHGIMLGVAYILTSVNVCWLFFEDPSVFGAMDIKYLLDPSNTLLFIHSWHIWLGIISMILGTLAFITHLGGWKTCNLGLPAVLLWTILGFTGMYLGIFFRM